MLKDALCLSIDTKGCDKAALFDALGMRMGWIVSLQF